MENKLYEIYYKGVYIDMMNGKNEIEAIRRAFEEHRESCPMPFEYLAKQL